MPRLRLWLPLAAFILLSLLLFKGLSLDPTSLPSALVGKALPEFELQELHSSEVLSRQDIIGEPMLVNIWATWCYSCRVEHPYLLDLAANVSESLVSTTRMRVLRRLLGLKIWVIPTP